MTRIQDTAAVEWRVLSQTPISPDRFAKDHLDTLLYVETCAVDRNGILAADQMRCNSTRHPFLYAAKTMVQRFGHDAMSDGAEYPTRLVDGEQPDHDDYDCLDDMVAAGWLTVTMPVPDPSGANRFVDGNGRPVPTDDSPALITGLVELHLGPYAKWALTDTGHTVAAALRKHAANGGGYNTFVLPPEATDA